MSGTETPVVFECGGEEMVGMVHCPDAPETRGILLLVGGPQYRVGSHRQFVLLARDLCSRGIAVMRFDFRGMGDSDGDCADFMSNGPDIAAAMELFTSRVAGLESVVLWGLCDAASAIMDYAHRDARVAGMVVLNPWVRNDVTMARTWLKQYYLGKLFSASWWRSLFRGEVATGAALRSLASTLKSAVTPRQPEPPAASHDKSQDSPVPAQGGSFVALMQRGLARFSGPVLLILSGQDLTAGEFRGVASTRRWRKTLRRQNVTVRELADANHTFARRQWRDEVAGWTFEWLRGW